MTRSAGRSSDWDDRFTSLINETESNLSKIKARLNYPNTGIPQLPHQQHKEFAYGRDLIASQSRFPSDFSAFPHHSNGDPERQQFLHENEARREFPVWNDHKQEQLTQPQRPTISEQMNSDGGAQHEKHSSSQSSKMDSLYESIRLLERDKIAQDGVTHGLKEEIRMLKEKLDSGVSWEHRGSQEQFQRTVTDQMAKLQSHVESLNRYQETVAKNEDLIASLVRDVAEIKRLFREEVCSIREEVDSVKLKFTRLESTSEAYMTDIKELTRKIDRTEQRLDEQSEAQRREMRDSLHFGSLGEVPPNDRQGFEVQDLKSALLHIDERIKGIEQPSGSSGFTSSAMRLRQGGKGFSKQRIAPQGASSTSTQGVAAESRAIPSYSGNSGNDAATSSNGGHVDVRAGLPSMSGSRGSTSRKLPAVSTGSERHEESGDLKHELEEMDDERQERWRNKPMLRDVDLELEPAKKNLEDGVTKTESVLCTEEMDEYGGTLTPSYMSEDLIGGSLDSLTGF